MPEYSAGGERREFVRQDYVHPLAYKVCKKDTVTKLLQGYTANVSQTGLLCNIKDKVEPEDILWLSFDRDTLSICSDIEKRSLIYQNGIIGKVVWAKQAQDLSYNVGIHFITREEKGVAPEFIIRTELSLGKKPDE
ncbi:MAG: PilZ domain-containing protein [Candidatus Omnitrophica bacterium]|nr:PilZ domain-containing protein [Candidatus Omnitrophota bacterium]